MKLHIRMFLIAILFAALASVFWILGRGYRDLSSISELLNTLQYSEAGQRATTSGHIWLTSALAKSAREERAAAAYWSKDYRALTDSGTRGTASEEPGPGERFIASNAAYREWELAASGGDRQTSIRRLDEVIKGYEASMKADPDSVDTAYNYEFAVRKREQLNQTTAPKTLVAQVVKSSIHGREGAPPKGSNMGQFKVIVPQRPEERKEDKEAGKADRIKKKG